MAATQANEDVIAVFDAWCKHHTDVSAQLADTEENLKKIREGLESASKTNARLQAECSVLQETLTQCQRQMHVVCDLEDENRQLKTQLTDKDQALAVTIKGHENAVQILKTQHETEAEDKLADLKAVYNKKLMDLETCMISEKELVATLQCQLVELKKEKEKEISRITMEYEGKLTKAQRQKALFIQQQQQVLNQDVMRKKMQHMKENYEQEIAALKERLRVQEEKNEQLMKQMQGLEADFSIQGQQQRKCQQPRCFIQTGQQNHNLSKKKSFELCPKRKLEM